MDIIVGKSGSYKADALDPDRAFEDEVGRDLRQMRAPGRLPGPRNATVD